MTLPMDSLSPEKVAGLREVAERANDEGAWCWEQCGDKCDAPIVGIAYRADDPDLKNVTGRLREWDEDGKEIKYERTLIAGINENLRWPSAYAVHIATFDPPTVLALLDDRDALRAEVEVLREALEKIAVSGNGGHWGRLARAALLPTSQPLKVEDE